MRKMCKVERFKCAWCGHEFRTPDKHDCKFDPDKKNCLSCRHDGYRGKETYKRIFKEKGGAS